MKKIILSAAIAGTLTMGATTASAQYAYVAKVNTALGGSLNAADGSGCLACHGGTNNSTGDKGVTPFATLWKNTVGSPAAATLTTAMTDALRLADSDGDGTDNATEAAAGTNFWGSTTTTTTTTTTTSDSGGGCVTSAATTPLMMVLAMLSLGFFVRRKKAK